MARRLGLLGSRFVFLLAHPHAESMLDASYDSVGQPIQSAAAAADAAQVNLWIIGFLVIVVLGVGLALLSGQCAG